MNQRILELASEFNIPKENLEKFTWGVIKECLKVVKDEVQYVTDFETANRVVETIKEHFGEENGN